MRIFLNLRSILYAEISGIAVNNEIIIPDEFRRNDHIMHICSRYLNGVNQPAARIQTRRDISCRTAIHCLSSFGASPDRERFLYSSSNWER